MPTIIGITTRQREITSSAGLSRSHTLNRAYSDAIEHAGAVPILLAPVAADSVDVLLGLIDGLVLTGGGDIDPARHGGVIHESVYGLDPERDAFELSLANAAAERRVPTLAICRGLQIMNVALGGTLHVDLPSEVGGDEEHSRTGEHVFESHQHVRLAAGCRLAAVLGTDLMVNSIHHQAVKDLAPGLRSVGWADDGVVEAVEHEDPDWPLWAVQWHPEFLAERDPDALVLFKAFVGSIP